MRDRNRPDGTRVSFVNGGNGFASQSTRRVHFGLGKAEKIDKLEVAWPSGEKQTFTNVNPDRIYHLVEGDAKLRPLAGGGRPSAQEAR